MKVAFRILGCRTNRADAVEMTRALEEGGVRVVAVPEEADVLVVLSCTVTRAADRDTRNRVYRARRRGTKVLVVGCLPAAQGTEADWADDGTELIPDRAGAVARLLELAGSGRQGAVQWPKPRPGSSRIFIRVQEGCDEGCAYCIVPAARGPARSEAWESIRDQVTGALEAGWKDLVLAGTHVGSWGRDLSPSRSLSWLMENLASLAGDARFRLASIEPQDLEDGILENLGPPGPFGQHLHLALQSGDDKVLERMGRGYTVREFEGLVQGAHRVAGAGLHLSLDVISGFPGETEAQFENSLRLLERLDFASCHAFTYSPRPGTPAADWPDQVPVETARRRTTTLRELGREKLRAFLKSFEGEKLEAMVEAWDPETRQARVLTSNYLRGLVSCREDPGGRWIDLKVTGYDEELRLQGVPVAAESGRTT